MIVTADQRRKIKNYYGLLLPVSSTVAVREDIPVKMVPLWRSVPSVSRSLMCRTSPVVRNYLFTLLCGILFHNLSWAKNDLGLLQSSSFMFNLLQKRLYAYAASPLSEPLVDLQAETAKGVDLSPQSVQVCEARHGIYYEPWDGRVSKIETSCKGLILRRAKVLLWVKKSENVNSRKGYIIRPFSWNFSHHYHCSSFLI